MHHIRGGNREIATVGHRYATQQFVANIRVEKSFGVVVATKWVAVRIGPWGVAQGIRPKTSSRPAQRALIEGHSDKCNVHVERVDVRAMWRAEHGSRAIIQRRNATVRRTGKILGSNVESVGCHNENQRDQ